MPAAHRCAGQTLCRCLQGDGHRPSHGRGGQCVRHHVRPRYRKPDPEGPVGGDQVELGQSVLPADVDGLGPDLGVGRAPEHHDPPRRGPPGEETNDRIVCVQHRHAVFGQRLRQLGLRFPQDVGRTEQLHVGKADVCHHSDVRTGHTAQQLDVSTAPASHLAHHGFGLGPPLQDGQRQPDLVVERGAAGHHPELLREDARGEVLGARLPGRAGDADHDRGQVAPGVGGQVQERASRILHLDHGDGVDGARPSSPDHGRGRASGQRLSHVRVTVRPVSAKGEERVSLFHRTAVDGDAGHQLIGRAANGARNDPGHVRKGPRVHQPTPRMAASSSAATRRSSKGTTRSANSWPVSCPFPAITTTSPRRAPARAIRTASRRSGSMT